MDRPLQYPRRVEVPLGILALTLFASVSAWSTSRRKPRPLMLMRSRVAALDELPPFHAPTPTAWVDAYIADALAATGTRFATPPPIPYIDIEIDEASDPGYAALMSQMTHHANREPMPEPLSRARTPRSSQPPRADTIRDWDPAHDDDETVIVARPSRSDTIV